MKPKKRNKKEQKRFEEASAKILQKQKDGPDPLFREWSVDSMANLKITLSGGPSPENRNIEREDLIALLKLLENSINLITYYVCSNECDAELSDITKSKNKLINKYGIKDL